MPFSLSVFHTLNKQKKKGRLNLQVCTVCIFNIITNIIKGIGMYMQYKYPETESHLNKVYSNTQAISIKSGHKLKYRHDGINVT